MDIALEVANQVVDIVVENGDVRADPGLRTAALLSMFSDARAAGDEIDQGEDPSGWWAETPGDPHGSKFFLLDRAKATPATVHLAAQYASAAFGWLVREGAATSTPANASVDGANRLLIEVTLNRGSARRWPQLWAGEALQLSDVDGTVLRLLPG